MNQTIKREQKITSSTSENYHQIIVKSTTARNTGPVQIFSEVVSIKWGMADRWIEANPRHHVLKVIDIIKK